MSLPADSLTLVADIGGTNTRVALADGQAIREDSITRFRNSQHGGLAEVLGAYLDSHGNPALAGACVAVAGPVRNGRGQLTNLDWDIDLGTLSGVTRAGQVAILNDLQAQGHALGQIPAERLSTLIPGPVPEGLSAKLVIGIGTGFNAAPVHDLPGGRLVVAAEAGHSTLPAHDGDEMRLSRFVRELHGFAAVEDILSGRGLVHIHRWLAAEAGQAADRDSAQILGAMDEDALSRQAVERFVRMMGVVAGDLALNHLPFGGIYLAGGMARAMTAHAGPMGFAEAFRDKGRFGPLMAEFAVHVIEDDYAALTGCACYLARGAAD